MPKFQTQGLLSITLAGCALLAAIAVRAAPTECSEAHAAAPQARAKSCDAQCLSKWFEEQRQLTDGSVTVPQR